MGRLPVFVRKSGAGSGSDSGANEGPEDGASENADGGADLKSGNGSADTSDSADSDVEICPNCACQFTDEDGDIKVVKEGKPVQGGGDYKGEDLAVSAPPVPGQMGTAHDAAGGTDALTRALAGVLGGQS